MATITVLDSTGATQTVNTLPAPGSAASAASLPVVIASDQGSVSVTNAAGSAIIGKVGIDQTTPGTTNGVQVNAALPAGSNIIGNVRIDQTTPGTTNGVFVSGFAAALSANQSFAQTIAQPSSASMAALNATVQWQVEPGVSHYMTLTNGPGATAQFSGTVTFQTSTDGATWASATAVPLVGPTGQSTSTATATGLWLIVSPIGASSYIRANMTAYTSGTVYALLTPFSTSSAVVPLNWTYTVTSGASVIPVMDVSSFSEIYAQISAVTTTVLTAQGTNDPTQATWDTIPVQEVKSQTAGARTITAAGTYKMSVGGYKWFRLQCTTTGTVLTVQGVAARTGSPITLNSYGNSVEAVIQSGTVTTVSTVTAVTSLSQIAASVPQMNIANGSTNKELGVSVATAITQTDVSAGAFAGAGRVNGTVISSAAGSGAWVSAEINVSALTLGTASSVFLILQESRGGTNFTDIWVSDPITATGIQSMPSIPVNGRRRWSAFSVGGTSTTVTVTVTTLEQPPMAAPLIRQMRDAYAATNPFALTFNSVALTASNFVLSTLGTATTPLYVEGAKVITAFMLLAGGPTVTTQPVVTMYGSMDGTNFVLLTGSTMTAAGNGLYSVTLANVAYKFVKLQVSTAAAFSSGSYTISNIGVLAVS